MRRSTALAGLAAASLVLAACGGGTEGGGEEGGGGGGDSASEVEVFTWWAAGSELTGLEALEEFITPRTAWLIEHHMEARALKDGTLGTRARRRLQESENFQDLMLLCDCDQRGRQRGVEAPDLEEAISYLRELAAMCG